MERPARDSSPEERVLLLTPTGGDTGVAVEILGRAGITAVPCACILDVCTKMEGEAGAIVVAEEALGSEDADELIDSLAAQEAWSDLPVIVLTTGGDEGHSTGRLTTLFQSVGNITLLERPFRSATLVSTVQMALRSRRKQYEVRNLLVSERTARNERQAAQDALAEALALFEYSIDAAEIGTFYCPMPLGTIVWNAKCKEHFWLPPDAEVDFDLFYSIIHPDDRASTRNAIERSIGERVPYDVQYRTLAPDGRSRWVRAKGRAHYAPDGSPTRFDGITIDISVQKEVEAEREKVFESERAARAEAERVSRMKDEFLATLSHEVRTPLNAIFGWVQILRRATNDPATVKEGITIIDRNVRHQIQLIDELLDMSRIISGKVRIDATRVDPAAVIDAALDVVRPAAEAKKVRLRKVLDPLAGPVTGDPSRLQQVVWNLLTNAVKFTPEGGRIDVGLERANARVEISVADTGEGIRPDFLPHIFERFRQADASTTRRHGGLGIGLGIVKNLVELHGGEVRAKSAGEGKGSTFVISLPARTSAEGDTAPGDQPQVTTKAPPEREPPRLAGVRVLVVDDEPDARGLVQRLLSECEAVTALAASASEAEAAVAEFKPDVILSDIGMPERDGYDFIRSLRRAGITTPAVALTAFARSEDRIRSIQAGYQTHLAKPVEPTELLAAVASLAGRLSSDADDS
jgi:signal transduction histidine kinase/CheY-like chemotaxis protein